MSGSTRVHEARSQRASGFVPEVSTQVLFGALHELALGLPNIDQLASPAHQDICTVGALTMGVSAARTYGREDVRPKSDEPAFARER